MEDGVAVLEEVAGAVEDGVGVGGVGDHEVGGGDTRFGVGTVARIREAAELADGRWALVCAGTRRLTVRAWLPDDPYPLALVEDRPDGALSPATAEHLAVAEGAVRRALALAGELGEAVAPATVELHPCLLYTSPSPRDRG